MGQFSQVPGLAGYQQQVAFNDQQGAQQMMKLSQLMNMAQQQQAMQQAPEDRAMKMELQRAQMEQYRGNAAENQAQAQERQAAAQKMQRVFSLSKEISALPDGHPERSAKILEYKTLVDPKGAFNDGEAMNNPLGKLFKMKAALPPGDPRHAIVDNAIRKESETARQISPPIIHIGDSMGKIPAGYRATKDGNLEAIPGGPADVKAQAQANMKASGATDVDLAVSTLRDAYDRLDKGGGITNTAKSGAENILPSLSSSGAGQAVGKMLGTANQSARNDIAMTRPALLAALMKATGMSAKQMDSNAELKLWLATATDPTLDVGSNRRALDNIEKKYLGLGGKPPQDVGGASGQDAEALAWANANPNDPRAAKIKAKLGAK